LYIPRSEKNKLKKYQEKRKAASTELEYQKRCVTVEKAETRIEKLKEKFAQVNPNFQYNSCDIVIFIYLFFLLEKKNHSNNKGRFY
jgi:hypothetical protein